MRNNFVIFYVFLSFLLTHTTSLQAKNDPQDNGHDNEYAAKIVEQIVLNKRSPGSLKLPDGWKIEPQRTYYSDHIAGLVLDAKGTPRIKYSGKTAIYDSYVNAWLIDAAAIEALPIT